MKNIILKKSYMNIPGRGPGSLASGPLRFNTPSGVKGSLAYGIWYVLT